MASGRSQPQTGTPQDLAAGLGCCLQPCVISWHLDTYPDAHFHQHFPRTQGALFPRDVSDDAEVGPQLRDVLSLVPKRSDCVGDVKHRGCTKCCHIQIPSSLPTGLCYGLLGPRLDSHFHCIATHTRAVDGHRLKAGHQANTSHSVHQSK